jgi:hypothetical protein
MDQGKGSTVEQLKAVVFVLTAEFDPHAARCVEYCEQQGYIMAGIVRDAWGAVLKMLGTGQADIVVVAAESHLPPRRRPRIEIVAQQGTAKRERRTRFIRRTAAG